MGRNMVCGGGRQAGKFQLTYTQLPEIEADATSDAYVCEFTAGSAANETGVGGGLSGSDLVLTQHGSIPGTVDGWRALAQGSSRYFSSTIPFLNTFVGNAGGFSFMWHLRNFVLSGDGYMLARVYTNYTSGQPHFNIVIGAPPGERRMFLDIADSYPTMLSGPFLGIGGLNADNLLPAGGEAYLVFSMDPIVGLSFAGIAPIDVQPKATDDFLAYAINPNLPDVGMTIATLTMSALVGSEQSNGAGFEVRSFTAAKYPVVRAA